MTNKLLLTAAIIGSALQINAQEIHEVTLSVNPTYANQTFYQFGTDEVSSVAKNSWDIAFNRTGAYSFATRINDAKGIQVYQAANSADQWDLINVSGEPNWTKLYNSDTDWDNGAFDNGTATFGWGEYNSGTHHVQGSIVFVLKYADGTFKKFMITDFFSAYTIKFSTWNGSTWSDTTESTISNTSNVGYHFNYFSLDSNALVNVAPADANWDLVFTQYVGNLGGGTMYTVTGTLQGPNVTVAEKDESSTPAAIPADDDYSDEINTIGYDWKTYTGGSYVVDSDTKYYVKKSDGTIYRLWFNTFEGTSTGNISFNYQDVTAGLGLSETASASFGLYPNPTLNKKTTLVYNLNKNTDTTGVVAIYSLTGQKVYEAKISANSGLYSKEIELNQLNAGVYIVKFQSGSTQETKKLIVK